MFGLARVISILLIVATTAHSESRNICFLINAESAHTVELQKALVAGITLLRAKDFVSVVSYGETVDVFLPSTSLTRAELVLSRARQLEGHSGSNHFVGISKAIAEIRRSANSTSDNKMILISSGFCGEDSQTLLYDLAESLTKDNIELSTISYGDSVDRKCLANLASLGGGKSYAVENQYRVISAVEQALERR